MNVDLTSTGTCFDIQADNVGLDCQQHSLTGNSAAGSIGIKISGKNGATIKNCVIKNFEAGFFVTDSKYHLIQSNSITPSVAVSNALNSRGIHFFKVSNSNVLENVISLSQNYQEGVRLLESVQNSVNSNKITTSLSSTSYSSSKGVHLWTNSNENRVSRNRIAGQFGTGIYVGYSAKNDISYNGITGAIATGIGVQGNQATTAGGNIVQNNQVVITAKPPGIAGFRGIEINGAPSAKVAYNYVVSQFPQSQCSTLTSGYVSCTAFTAVLIPPDKSITLQLNRFCNVPINAYCWTSEINTAANVVTDLGNNGCSPSTNVYQNTCGIACGTASCTLPALPN